MMSSLQYTFDLSKLSPFILLISCLVLTPIAMAKPTFTWSTGFYHSEGRYTRSNDIEKTAIKIIPLSIKWQNEQLWFKAAGSYLQLDGPGGIEESTQSNQAELKRKGVGDLFLSAGKFYRINDYWLEINGKLKLPTGDETKQLSTGAHDLTTGAQLIMAQRKHTLYLKGALRYREDPDYIDLKNTGTIAVGGYKKLSNMTAFGAQLEWQSRTISGGETKQEMILFLNIKLPNSSSFIKKVSPYIATGKTRRSPDFAIGLTLKGDF